MKILFKYPTFGRKDWFFSTLDQYYAMIDNKTDFKFVISMNNNDPSMNNDEVKAKLDGYSNLEYHYGDHSCKIAAVNADMKGQDFDILFLVSDDMIPQVQGFDNRIREDMRANFPLLDGALHYNDGFYGKDVTITLSIMGKALYDHFGYIYHPDYKSIYCDNEFTEVVQGMKKVVYSPDVIVKHDWKGGGNSADETYLLSSKLGVRDRDVYLRRKADRFPR